MGQHLSASEICLALGRCQDKIGIYNEAYANLVCSSGTLENTLIKPCCGTTIGTKTACEACHYQWQDPVMALHGDKVGLWCAKGKPSQLWTIQALENAMVLRDECSNVSGELI